MTAKYTCNGCNADIPRGDSSDFCRQLKDASVTVYVRGEPEDGGDLHLCGACICKVITEGVPPVRDPDHIPF